MSHPISRILHAPSALPKPAWLRDHIVWADSMSAIWPGSPAYEDPTPEPKALTPSQDQALEEIQFIRDQVPELNLFEPIYLDGREQEIEAATRRFTHRQAHRTMNTTKSTPSLRNAEFLGKSESDAPSDWLNEEEAIEYLHDRKLPQSTLSRLIQFGALEPREDGIGYRSTQVGVVAALLVQVGSEIARKDERSLVADSPSSAIELLDPASRRTKHLAVASPLPALPAINPDIDIRKLLELRTADRYESTRAEFIAFLHDVLNASHRFVDDIRDAKTEREIRQRVEFEYRRRLDQEISNAKQPIRAWLKSGNFVEFSATVGVTIVTQAENFTEVNLPNIVNAAADAGRIASEILYCRAGSEPFLRQIRTALT